jgi:molybdopterin biosynthesis enzyme
MVRANGLIILPEEAATARQGDTVTVQLRDDSLERMPTPRF